MTTLNYINSYHKKSSKQYILFNGSSCDYDNLLEILKPEKIISLNELNGLVYKIAKTKIKLTGFYTCRLNGINTLVLS